MEIEELINGYSKKSLVKITKKEKYPGGIFVDLYVVTTGREFTVQYNEKGIISIYLGNSQFYDQPDVIQAAVINAIINDDVIEKRDRRGGTYFCVEVDNNVLEPTRYT